MAAVPLDQRVRRADVLWRRAGDRVLIRRIGNDNLLVLAGTGAELWATIDGERTVGAIVASLAEAHDVGVDVVSADVQAAIAELVAEQVVVAP